MPDSLTGTGGDAVRDRAIVVNRQVGLFLMWRAREMTIETPAVRP